MFDMKCFVQGSNYLEFLLLMFNVFLLLNNIPTYLSSVVFSEGVECDLLFVKDYLPMKSFCERRDFTLI